MDGQSKGGGFFPPVRDDQTRGQEFDEAASKRRALASRIAAGEERATFPFGETPLELIADRVNRLPAAAGAKLEAGKFSMQLVSGDMLTVLEALKDGKEAAVSLRVSILETLGIEEV